MDEAEKVAWQVWQELSPRDGEELAYCDGIFLITTPDSGEGFDFHLYPDEPFGQQVSSLADKMQSIIMEARQEMVPECPLHPAAHPLDNGVVDGAAAWVCPWTKQLVRSMKVSPEAA